MSKIIGSFPDAKDNVLPPFRCPECKRLARKSLQDLTLYTPEEGLTHFFLKKVTNRYVLDGMGCEGCGVGAPLFIILTDEEASHLVAPASKSKEKRNSKSKNTLKT
jgi:hypothetical protein